MLDTPGVAGASERLRRVLVACSGPAAVVAVVLLANLPGLTAMVHPNPLDATALAARHVVGGYLPGNWYTDGDVGYTAQALGHRAALDWLHGQVPWWNPFEGIGSPLAAEMQSAAFFPPVLLFALSNGSLYFHVLLEASAGVATWFLLRELAMSRLVATVGGIVFGLNGTFAWLVHAPMNPVALLPLLLFGIERSYRHPERDSGWVLIALALALSLYAGFPETAYLDGLMGAAWAAVRLAQATKGRRARFAGRLGLGAVTGALLALPLGVAFAEYLPQAYVGLHAGSRLGDSRLHPVNLPILGLPYLYGPISAFASRHITLSGYWAPAGGFVTASTVVLAISGVVGARRERGLRIMLGALGVVVLLWVFGVEPFARLTTVLPFMAHVDVTRYSSPVWELALVVLACFGLDCLGRDRRARAGLLAGGLTLAVLGVLVLGHEARTVLVLGHEARTVLVGVTGARNALRAWALATTVWAGAIVVAAVVLGVLPRRRWTVAPVAALLVLDAVVMAGIPQLSAPRSAVVDEAPIAFLRAHLGYGRYFSLGAYHSDYGSYFGTAQLNESDLPVPRAWADEITGYLGHNSNPIRFDGTQVVRKAGRTPAEQALANLAAYERLDVRYFVARTSKAVFGPGPSYPGGLRRVFHDGFASIFALPNPQPYFSTTSGACALKASSRDLVVATCPAPATLVRSELDLAGWSATVNGQPAPVIDEGGLVSAVALPAGQSTVVFAYAPPHADLSVAGFLLGLLALIAIPVLSGVSRHRRRRRRRGRGWPRSLGRGPGASSSGAAADGSVPVDQLPMPTD